MSMSGWTTKKVKYNTMRAREFISETKKHTNSSVVDPTMSSNEKTDKDIEEWKASRQLCTSTKPDSELGSSALSSCKSQGFRARDTDKKFTLNKKRQKIKGKKVKGGNYGGPLPVWKGNQ